MADPSISGTTSAWSSVISVTMTKSVIGVCTMPAK